MTIKFLTTRFRHALFSTTATTRSTSITVTSSSSASPSSSSSIHRSTAVPADIGDVTEEDVDDFVDGGSPAVPSLLQPRVVVYDGVCHFCHRGVKWVIKADKYKKIKFCCLQSKAAEPYLRVSGLDREDVCRRFLFIEGYGSYHQGSTAALRVLSYLPPPYSALSSFSIIPTPLRDTIYDIVARNHYHRFGKAENCLVLKEDELLERFIDREELLDQRNRW